MSIEETLSKQDEVISALQELNAFLNVNQLFFEVSAVSTGILRIKEAYKALEKVENK